MIVPLVKQIRHCNMGAIGVLADWLEEQGDPRAGEVRSVYIEWLHRLNRHINTDEKWRHKIGRAESLRRWMRDLTIRTLIHMGEKGCCIRPHVIGPRAKKIAQDVYRTAREQMLANEGG